MRSEERAQLFLVPHAYESTFCYLLLLKRNLNNIITAEIITPYPNIKSVYLCAKY